MNNSSESGMLGGLVAAEAIKKNNVSESFLNKYVKDIDRDFTKRHKTLYKNQGSNFQIIR